MVNGLAIRDAEVDFGPIRAVAGVNLDLVEGDILALLGASGSGKSTLLRSVAGLQPLTRGRISWNGKDLAGVKVHRRGFGLVFQDAQLFVNMNVGRNVAYGIHRMGTAAKRRRVAEMLELVGLSGYEHRRVVELSGGEAQRVALARSLAPSPRVLLLDEPLSALEHDLRRRLAEDLSRILREVGSTAIHVTHDQAEASMIGDTVAIMAKGRILQRDRPAALWHHPNSKQVARFLGNHAFLDEPGAHRLGWEGRLPTGHVLAVGPRSFVRDDEAIQVPVLSEGFSQDQFMIEILLPDGQRARVASDHGTTRETIGVRLQSGAITPEDR